MTSASTSGSDVEHVVRRYVAVVGDLASTEDDLRAVLSEDVTVTEHPNALTPLGTRRGFAETMAGFLAGKALLREQTFEVAEVLTSGDRAAVRATWQGTVGRDTGPYKAGLQLRAHIAALLTVRDGKVVEHETFDCYEPFEL